MTRLLSALALMSLLLTGAIFGFFYAWICSTMWGLDAASPDVAIRAMQAMNASVRNVVFAPAFFGTPFVLGATAAVALVCGLTRPALTFAAAGMTYLVGAMVLTMSVNVPMNEALALVVVPEDTGVAARIWVDYSAPWQFWNTVRTIASGVALALTGYAIYMMNGHAFKDRLRSAA